jgi:thiol-disulfide isomerase/thioredoxin
MAAGLLIGAIVGISSSLARADRGTCDVFSSETPGFNSASVPMSAPDIIFFEDGTTERRLADYAGHPIVLNFWATWCAPCVSEMPDLEALRLAYIGDGIEVLSINEDRTGMDKINPFYAKTGIVHLPKMVDYNGMLSRALGVVALPTTILFDGHGLRLGEVVGTARWGDEKTQQSLRACLNGGTAH